jgi:predicted PurR-regulated permease PerM
MSRFESTRAAFVTVGLALVLVLLWALRDIVVMVALAVLLAFVLAPLVKLLEKVPLPRGARIPRGLASAIVVLGLVVVMGWLLSLGIPRIGAEVGRLAERIPGTVQALLGEAGAYGVRHGLSQHIDPVIGNLRANAATYLESLGVASVQWLGRLFGNLGQILQFLLLPVLAFYLLSESEAVRDSMARFLPEDTRGWVAPVQRAVDRALSSYVRGQAIVCVVMGTLVGVALAIAGYPGATVLGVIVGLAEIVPFIGYWTAMLAIVLIGLGVSPALAITGFVIYTVLNAVNSYVILPRVMGQHLRLHPFVIIVSVLAGATLLGPVGVLIALPGAAVVQALIEELAGTRGGKS